MKRLYLFLSLVLLLVFTACSNQVSKSIESSISGVANVKKVKVLTNQANVRVGVDDSSPVLQTVNKNATLDVINQVSDRYAVRLPGNKIGFIPTNQCKTITADNAPLINTTSKNTGAGVTTPSPTPTTPTTNTATDTNITPPPATGTTTTSLTSDEQQMVSLVNAARTQNNVPALTVDIKLTDVARTKAQDMINNNYFDHNSPTYGSPFDMMKSFGIVYSGAGENIAGNQTVQNAHDSLMNSPGHKANILNASFTHIGIGIKDGGTYGKMFTQMFITKAK
ncbi:MAG TPA: serine protease [Clostridiales bacterium]|nr:MAG: hypothetical protein A2Y22_03260 [Clostridiales bacterium GWD2_32_59]HAN10699.1 serine protease [Clostridiales bacterium]